jgi:hypothetical protein
MEILGQQLTPELLTEIFQRLPEAELNRLQRAPGFSSYVFFHCVGLVMQCSFTVRVPGQHGEILVGHRQGPRHVIYGVVNPDGRNHWQDGPNPLVGGHGPNGAPGVLHFEGQATDQPTAFFNAVNPEGYVPFGYQYNRANAKLLFDELASGTQGLITKMDQWNASRDRMRAAVQAPERKRPVPVLYFSGVAGCGKSYRVRKALLAQRAEISWWLTVVSPLNALNRAWLALFPNPTKEITVAFKTHEKALFNSPQLLVIDEAQKLPGHYLDLYIATHPDLRYVILLGDPFQCGPPITSPTTVIPACDSPGIALGPRAQVYLEGSYRVNAHVASVLHIPIFHGVDSRIHRVNRIPFHLPIVVATMQAQSVYSGYGKETYTMSSVGGLDFDTPYVVVLGRELLSGVPSEAIYTAFTRSRCDIYVYSTLTNAQEVRAMNTQPLLSALLTGVPLNSPFRDFIGLRGPPLPVRVNPVPLWYGGAITTVLDFIRTSEIAPKFDELEPIMRSAMLPPPPSRAVLPENQVKLDHADPVLDGAPSYFPENISPHHDMANSGFYREEVEMFSEREGCFSRQFQDDTPADNIHGLDDIFADHSRTDPALIGPTIEKRLRFASHEDNERDFHDHSFLGPLLLEAFVELFALPDDIPWDEELFESCVDDCARSRLRKSAPALNSLARDQDYTLRDSHTVLNFLKSQLINKLDTFTRYVDGRCVPKVKPAQLITTYTEEINALFGPLTRYLTVKLRQVQGRSNAMVYGGMSLDDLSQWSKDHISPEVPVSFANDFTQYDKSVRGDSLNFEVQVMRLFNVPVHYVDFHVDLTCHLKSHFGTLGIMRTSGQWCTYIFNSWFGAAYFRLRYDFDLTRAIGFSGDDMFLQDVPVERSGWRRVAKFFHLVSKPVLSRFPEFCGWTLTHYGAFRSPKLLAFKLHYHHEHGSLERVALSYYLEYRVGFLLGDLLWDVMDFDDIMYMGSLATFFTEFGRLVPKSFRLAHAFGTVQTSQVAPAENPTVELNVLLRMPGFLQLEFRRLPVSLQKDMYRVFGSN